MKKICILLLFATALGTAACGKKGDLSLPPAALSAPGASVVVLRAG